MTVKTAKVTGRRQLSFHSLDDIIADAGKVVAAPGTKMLGNWPLDRLLMHLTFAINGSIDGIAHKAPWFICMIGPFIKRRILTRTMSAGFHLPGSAEAGFFPATGSSEEALQKLRSAVARTRQERMTGSHPVLGKLTHEEWTQLHMRHAELHLSFAVPG